MGEGKKGFSRLIVCSVGGKGVSLQRKRVLRESLFLRRIWIILTNNLNMKKFLPFLVFAMLCMGVWAQEDSEPETFTDGDYLFEITSDSTVAVCGLTRGSSEVGEIDIVVPDSATYGIKKYTYRDDDGNERTVTEVINRRFAVTAVAHGAFMSNHFRSITLPEGITEIGNYAFSRSIRITSLEFPSTLRTIGQRAFSTCPSLLWVRLPEGLKEMGSWCFGGCESLSMSMCPRR